jgi:hypothetical protein
MKQMKNSYWALSRREMKNVCGGKTVCVICNPGHVMCMAEPAHSVCTASDYFHQIDCRNVNTGEYKPYNCPDNN